MGQDTYYVGYIKGIGKISQQTAIDTYSNVGFAKVYTDKNALVAADFMNDKILPFFDEYSMTVLRMLTDRGTEYCGKRKATTTSFSFTSMILSIQGLRLGTLRRTVRPRSSIRPSRMSST